MTEYALFQAGMEELNRAGITDAQVDAKELLLDILNQSYSDFILNRDLPISDEVEKEYYLRIERRKKHEPLQYITGTQGFMGYTFKVSPAVLIPRLDTEVLVEEAEKQIRSMGLSKLRILDLCCGSGCIGLSLKKRLSDLNIELVLADLSEDALVVTKENAKNLEVDAQIIKSDLFDRIEGKFDLILSNPPYIREEVIPTLDPEVRLHEPAMALNGGKDGLNFYRQIVLQSLAYLKEDGYVFFEIGYDQASDIRTLFVDAGYRDICIIKDLAGLDRVVYARR